MLLGPQDDAFSDEGIATFFASDYTVTALSDRMGCRLEGPRVQHAGAVGIVSDGTVFGSSRFPATASRSSCSPIARPPEDIRRSPP